MSWRRGRVSGAALLGARGGMPSIWRPNVRVTLDEDGEVEDTERGRGADEEGHEAEESPSHEGAVRARGEVSVELQGVQSLSPRSSAL